MRNDSDLENGYPNKDEWFVEWVLPMIVIGLVVGACLSIWG